MATLTGTPAQNFDIEIPESLPDLPPIPRAGLPLDLIRRRPDILREYNPELVYDFIPVEKNSKYKFRMPVNYSENFDSLFALIDKTQHFLLTKT